MADNQPPNDDKLLAYFMGQTNTRLVSIEEKLVELIAFRAEVVASAKATSISMSVIISILGLVIHIVLKKMGYL